MLEYIDFFFTKIYLEVAFIIQIKYTISLIIYEYFGENLYLGRK